MSGRRSASTRTGTNDASTSRNHAPARSRSCDPSRGTSGTTMPKSTAASACLRRARGQRHPYSTAATRSSTSEMTRAGARRAPPQDPSTIIIGCLRSGLPVCWHWRSGSAGSWRSARSRRRRSSTSSASPGRRRPGARRRDLRRDPAPVSPGRLRLCRRRDCRAHRSRGARPAPRRFAVRVAIAVSCSRPRFIPG